MVVLSSEAKSALESLQSERGGAAVRLSARQVCDCGKIGFDLSWESHPSSDDLAESQGPLRLIYDRESEPYVSGLEVGYRDELMGKSFTFYNPNLKNGGGCGREFK